MRALPLDGAGLDLALDLSVEVDLGSSDLTEMQAVAFDFPSCMVWIGETLIAVLALIPRIP